MTAVKATSSRPAGFWMPTHDQLVKTYKGIIEGREKAHSLKPMKHAPANAAKYPAYNISSGLGVGKTVYVIKGEMYLKTQVVSPNAKPHWFKAGPAPLF